MLSFISALGGLGEASIWKYDLGDLIDRHFVCTCSANLNVFLGRTHVSDSVGVGGVGEVGWFPDTFINFLDILVQNMR